MSVDPVSVPPTTDLVLESLKPPVHYLIAELVKSTNVEASPEGDSVEALDQAKSGGSNHTSSDHTVDCSQSSFIVQIVTELAFSNIAWKVTFLSYSPKKDSTSGQ